MAINMQSIKVEDISCRYGKKQVISNLSFSLQEGECVALVGDNGCGKSTLLQMMAGVKKYDNGVILYYDQKMSEKLCQEMVGYVPQESVLVEECSVKDNLCLWYSDHQQLKQEIMDGFLREFGIPQMLHVKCNKLSGGMKKKVSIACALACNPRILLLDEPCAALDLSSKKLLRDYLVQYAKKGNTVLMATHEEADIAICKQVITLS